VNEFDLMYDENEQTTTRFVGFVGAKSRFDVAITETNQFFGKKLVFCLQSGRSAILTAEEADHPEYIANAFQVSDEEAKELAAFLNANL